MTQSTAESSGRGWGIPRTLSLAVAALTAVVGLLVLVGWGIDSETLKRIRPQWVAMNPATALLFFLAAASLAMSCMRRPRLGWAARILAAAVALAGFVKLLTAWGAPDLHVDQVLFASKLTESVHHASGAIFINRMAPNTALLFVLSGLALLGVGQTLRTARRGAVFLALVIILASILALIGYFNGVATLYQTANSIPIALHTVLEFMLLALGILLLSFPGRSAGIDEAGNPQAMALDRKISLGFGAALFLLAIIATVSFASIQNFVAASALAQHTRDVMDAISDLGAAAVDAETGARGYVISGEADFLAPHEAAVASIHKAFEQLTSVTAGDPVQRERVTQLQPLIERHLALLQQMIAARQGRASSPLALPTLVKSKGVMDDIRAILAAMNQTEDQMQAVRSQQAAYTGSMTTAVISAGGLLAFALVGLAGWMIRRDLLQRRQMEAELRRARAQADQANHAKSSFLANMSHEIRTPMSAIIGYADLILDPHQTSSDRLDYINTIRRNGDHLLTIINDVLDLSKIEAQKLLVEQVDCCPCRILSDVASLMRVRAAEKRISFEVKNDGPIPASIRSDPARLRQILINLVGNAIKFTDEGWVRLIMKLEEIAGQPARLRFDIVDTGIGMNAEQIKTLFQPFVQADDSTTRRFGGTGLGLTISKRLAELLGGRVGVDSAPGRGSTFSLLIDPGPLENVKRLNDCREALAGTDINHPAPASNQLNGRILLVDDGPDNRRLLSVYLRHAGASVALAENGRIGCDKALASLANGAPYDVILMDMQMPELDGYGATARLRTKGYTGPIIALTAHAMAEDKAKCLGAGCTDYLSKPVRRDDLLSTVARYLAQVKTQRMTARADDLRPLAPGAYLDFAPTIKSDLDDESLRSFLDAYIKELPSRVMELQACLDQGDIDLLGTKLHNLKGTGGLYGLMPITTEAAKAEALIQNKAPLPSIEAQVHQVMQVIRRVEGFAVEI